MIWYLHKDNLGNTLSSQAMNIQVVDTTGIASYQIEQIGTMYAKAPEIRLITNSSI